MLHYEQCVAVKRYKLGNEHAETLASVNNLASLLSKMDRRGQEKAESLFREVLSTKRRLLGGSHSDTLILIGNLGALLIKMGQYCEAEYLL